MHWRHTSLLIVALASAGCPNNVVPGDATTDNLTPRDAVSDQRASSDAAADRSVADAVVVDSSTDTSVELDVAADDVLATDTLGPDVADATPPDALVRTDASDAAAMDSAARADASDAAAIDALVRTDASSDAAFTDAPVASCTGRTGAVGDRDITLTSGGLARRYLIHVPTSYRATRAMQVVLNYHGFNNTGMSQNGMSGMNTAADARGFIAVHPYGTNTDGSLANLSWNAGRCCGSAPGRRIDDVQFTRDMLNRIESEYCVDTRRVFATGWSNGAMFTHRLACELADRIAAIGPVSGTLGISTCAPSRPIAVLSTHGTADMNVPWDGGPPGNTEPVPVTVAGWATRDRCTDTTPTEIFRLGTRHCDTRRACAAGTEVELCTIEGGGHNWSNTPPTSTTTQILDFFALHPMP